MNKWRYTTGKIPALSTKQYLVSMVFLFFCIPSVVAATIRFEDVSEQSGVNSQFSTAAAAWGDLNGDGWPDLWVSNHWSQPPSIYVNQKDGTFRDISADLLVGDELSADYHGANWVDFDNDGDQDLFVTTGGGGGVGNCPNYFFINDGGKLKNEAVRLKLDYHLGRGRTPLWLDADRDGKLDLLLMNRSRPGGKAPSAIFLQTTDGFVSSNDRFHFNPSGVRSRQEKVKDLFSNAIHMRWRKGPGHIEVTEKFAQLADLSGDRELDLVSQVKPMRIYSTLDIPFKEITNDMYFPSLSFVRDIAIADFSGDNKMDMFFVRSTPTKEVVQVGKSKLQGRVIARSGPRSVHFQSEGAVTFNIFTPWLDPSVQKKDTSVLFAGNKPPVPFIGRSITITLDPLDPSLHEINKQTDKKGVFVEYVPAEKLWKLRSSLPAINFVATSTKPIAQFETIGFKSSKGGLKDYLLIQNSKGFQESTLSGFTDRSTPCFSVAAGDFDNDMDMDLYLVCGSPAQNRPNILYENDGSGRFTEVGEVGGVAGSELGRGSQVVSADYDRDGFLDLFVTNGAGQSPLSDEGPHQLFHNKGNANHWLEIDLSGTISNRDAVGSFIELEAGGVLQIRNQGGGIHSFSQDHQRIHFGLGQNTQADKITVRWPSGITQELKDVKADQILQLEESASLKK